MGGGLDQAEPFYARSANRVGIAADFPPMPLEKMDELVQQSTNNSTETSKKKGPNGFTVVHAYKDDDCILIETFYQEYKKKK